MIEYLPTIVASAKSILVIFAHLDLPVAKSKSIKSRLIVFHSLPLLWRCWPLQSLG